MWLDSKSYQRLAPVVADRRQLDDSADMLFGESTCLALIDRQGSRCSVLQAVCLSLLLLVSTFSVQS